MFDQGLLERCRRARIRCSDLNAPKEPAMYVCRVSILMACVLGVTIGRQAHGGQSGRGNAAADIPILPYRLVEWPTPPNSAAGVPAGPWNFIQVASVAVTARGTILVLHRGAHPIMEFEGNGKFVRS